MTRRQAIRVAEHAVTEWGVFLAHMLKGWRPVDAVYLSGGLCVHPHIPAYPMDSESEYADQGFVDGLWVVAHVATGLRIGDIRNSPEAALAVAGHLLSLDVDWTLGQKTIIAAVTKAKLNSEVMRIAY